MKKKNETTTDEALEPSKVLIPKLKSNGVGIEIVGTAPLIQNCFNQKAMEQMLRKHMGVQTPRELKKPREAVAQARILNTTGEVCLLPYMIKAGIIYAGSSLKEYARNKTALRQCIYIEGQSIPITYDEMVPRVDMTRVGGKQPDVRFRPEFRGWRARFVVSFQEPVTLVMLLDLLNRAGRSSGVCEWRPQKNGSFGTYKVERMLTPAEAGKVEVACRTPLVSLVIPEWAMDGSFDPATLAEVLGSSPDQAERILSGAKRGRKATAANGHAEA